MCETFGGMLGAINRFCCWRGLLAGVALMKIERLPKAARVPGRSPALFVSENLSMESLERSGCIAAEPCPRMVKWREHGQIWIFRFRVPVDIPRPDRVTQTQCGVRLMSI